VYKVCITFTRIFRLLIMEPAKLGLLTGPA
jgi:hypothetical protein